MLKAGNFDVLAIWGWDRMSRQGAEEAFRFLRQLEEHLGVHFFSLQEPFLCTDASREQRELLLPIIAWVARWESARKSARLVAKAKTGRAQLAGLGQRARWSGGHLAMPEEVARIKALKAGGMTERGIAREVGLSKSQVHRILKGEVKSVDL